MTAMEDAAFVIRRHADCLFVFPHTSVRSPHNPTFPQSGPTMPSNSQEPLPMRYVLFTMLPLLAAADFPTIDKLPASKELPDPLTTLDGEKIKSADEWTKVRRPELKQLFQHYVYGQFPAAPKKVTAKILHEEDKAYD